jgi:predicted DNA repair protein MutK
MPSSLFLLLDDIASVLDDVSVMTKVAAKKTAGVLGDDLALNAQQVSGVASQRELPVVWAVARGSAINKAILVPAALAISAVIPWVVTPLLILGGAYLCYEGVEKLAHTFRPRGGGPDEHAEPAAAGVDEDVARAAALAASLEGPHPSPPERARIRGAIRTDFILSAEIVVITLGTVADKPFGTRLGVLVAISAIMTAGVYGLVAGIVKLDDGGLALTRRRSAVAQAAGRGILAAAPWLMRGLSIAGTVAMFLVGGGILTHGIGPLHHLSETLRGGLSGWPDTLASMGFDAVCGVALGIIVVAVVAGGRRLRVAFRAPR